MKRFLLVLILAFAGVAEAQVTVTPVDWWRKTGEDSARTKYGVVVPWLKVDGLSSFHDNGDTCTAGAGDSVRVRVAGISPSTAQVVAGYSEATVLTDKPAWAKVWAADTVSIYGTAGKKLTFFLSRK